MGIKLSLYKTLLLEIIKDIQDEDDLQTVIETDF